MNVRNTSGWLPAVAKAGLFTKSVVYCLIGIFAFMAAFHISGQRVKDADTSGVFGFVEDQPAGKWLLLIIAIGLACYAVWRVVEAFTYNHKSSYTGVKKVGKPIGYIFSALGHFALAIAAFKMVLDIQEGSSGGTNENLAATVIDKPWGKWLIGLFALIMIGIGIYQIYYALSDKYKKHVSSLSLHNHTIDLLVKAGKVGYIARGVAWMIIGWMLGKAAWNVNAAQAGDTADVFQFLQSASYGTYLLGAMGAGLVCFGLFYFLRARYEKF